MKTPRSGNAPPAVPIVEPRRMKFGAAASVLERPKWVKPPPIQEGAPVGSFTPGTEARVKVNPCKPEVKW